MLSAILSKFLPALAMKRFVDAFVSPVAMIDGVRNKPDFWTPIVAMPLLQAGVGALHVALVDHAYFAAETINAQRAWRTSDGPAHPGCPQR